MKQEINEILSKFIVENLKKCPVSEEANVSICCCWKSDFCWNCIIEYADFLNKQ